MRDVSVSKFRFAFLVCLSSCGPARPALVASATRTTAQPVVAVESGCSASNGHPTREAFFREALFAQPTDTTPLFDDYTADSYHVDKLDLARGLPAAANRCGVKLQAVLVVGPTGPLWSYYVATLLQDGPSVRLNTLVMPHARITGKGTTVMPTEEAVSLLDGIEKAPLVQAGLPTIDPSAQDSDFTYRVLLTVYESGAARYFHANFNEYQDSPDASALIERANALLSKGAVTYRIGDRKRKSPTAQ